MGDKILITKFENKLNDLLYQDNVIDDTKIITEQDVINSVRELNNYWVTKIKDIKQQLHIAT